MTEKEEQSEITTTFVPTAIAAAPAIGVPEESIGLIERVDQSNLKPEHAEFAEFHEDYVRSYISLADTKGSWAFAIASGVLVYLFTDNNIREVLLSPSLSCRFGLVLLTGLLMVASAVCSFLVVAPRLSAPSGDGIVFFGAVAKHRSATEYIDNVASMSPGSLTHARLKHCFDISRICHRKYVFLRFSIWMGVSGLLGALVTVLWLGNGNA